MSVYCASLAWRHGPEDRNDLLVLLAIADFADDDGYCWPSVKTLAAKARMTERGVQKIIRRLEVQGYVSVETGTGRKNCNEYQIDLDLLQKGERETPNRIHPEQGSPRTRKQKPRTGKQKRVNGGSPEPSRNHQNRYDDDDDDGGDDARANGLKDRIVAALALDEVEARTLCGKAGMTEACRWLDLPHIGTDEICEMLREVMARKRGGLPNSMSYFTGDMLRLSEALEEAKKPLVPIVRARPADGQDAGQGMVSEAELRRAGVAI
ncbi:helix-turn-helix domain-containing protein [Paracoccus siganidrum]|uniref:Helix-turn-helix domain-containing protein n=1 Tax=Paracoccus siganidrum TaxID=1276757 RepID=A0A419A4C9_9RHOB|nr:helix-turn-helix domain-containing protein [Paracoccus siganidrum]RJL09427.1 helix-turn-helix domain-containing protein [Paracoccus siganidrum]RMC39006.1 hypothetical protein C9E82_06650 [Paracoccus siganidrum]